MTSFTFNVTPTKTFDYVPTELQLQVVGKEKIKNEEDEEVEMVRINTWLIQHLPNDGKIIEIKNHLLPTSILSAFTGFDGINPIINPAAVDVILAGFNLTLSD